LAVEILPDGLKAGKMDFKLGNVDCKVDCMLESLIAS
jgi:hypothetical protein